MSERPECYGKFVIGPKPNETCKACAVNGGCFVDTATANKVIGTGGATKLDTGKRKLSLIHPSVIVCMLTAKDKELRPMKEAIYHLSEAAHAKDEADFIAAAYQSIADIVCYIGDEVSALELMTVAMEYGANKPEYGRNNWKKGMEWSRLIDAAQRHGLAILGGEAVDKDSGNPHVAHMLASIHMLLGNHAMKVGTNDLY